MYCRINFNYSRRRKINKGTGILEAFNSGSARRVSISIQSITSKYKKTVSLFSVIKS